MGGLALTQVLPGGGIFSVPAEAAEAALSSDDPLAPKAPHFPPKVKSVIWLHIDGAPSSLDLYDYKPQMRAYFDRDLPESAGREIADMRRTTASGLASAANEVTRWTAVRLEAFTADAELPAEGSDKATQGEARVVCRLLGHVDAGSVVGWRSCSGPLQFLDGPQPGDER